MYSYFTFLELVKAISVHRAHRFLSESTLILCTLRKRPMEHEQLRGRDEPSPYSPNALPNEIRDPLVTPLMEAGVSDRVCSLSEIIALP